MVRPRKDYKNSKHSVSLSPEAQAIIEQGGYQTNLSAFIDGLIRNTSSDSPVIIGIRIERLSKEIAKKEEELLSMRTERDVLQAQLNLFKQRGSSEDQKRDDARMELLKKWEKITSKDSIRGVVNFTGWLTGPANIHLIRDAGFQTADEAMEWCKKEAKRH
jgi:hypothetical protein